MPAAAGVLSVASLLLTFVFLCCRPSHEPAQWVEHTPHQRYGGCSSKGESSSGVCKEWEASTAEAEALGVRRAILRTGVVLAREGGALPKMTLPFKMMAGGPLGNGRQWLPWIHLADEVGAIRFLAESAEARGPFNLTAPNPVTNRELAGILASVLHRPGFMPAPGFALRLVLGEMADMLLNGQRVVPSRLQELGRSSVSELSRVCSAPKPVAWHVLRNLPVFVRNARRRSLEFDKLRGCRNGVATRRVHRAVKNESGCG